MSFAFSVLHTSARPDMWQRVFEAWRDSSTNWDACEYILVMDERWDFTDDDMDKAAALIGRTHGKVIWNSGRRCYVDGVNLAAAASTGDVLIVNADDQYPCDKWDEALGAGMIPPSTSDFVVEVSTNTPTEHERGIMVMPILSRERYERFGWVLYPAYESMFSDNDFCAMAKRDGVVIDARHLVFPHKHWINGQREKDEQDRAQNRDEAYNEGRKLFAARKRINFAGVPPQAEAPSIESQLQPFNTDKPLIVVLTPGNTFSAMWFDAFITLFGYLIPKYNISHWRHYTSSVAANRTFMARGVLGMDYGAPVDYVLWIDDDNAVTPEQFEMLLADLKAHPEYDAVAGWTWCGADDNLNVGYATISCGDLVNAEATKDGEDVQFAKIRPISTKEIFDKSTPDLIEIGYSGFPVVLMRYGLLKKAGKKLFTPFVDDRCEHGVSGEDIAFFARATIRSGARYAVDKRVEVPHFKMRAIQPVPTNEQVQEAQRLAAQLAATY